jgi:glucose-6-phosphate isomerase
MEESLGQLTPAVDEAHERARGLLGRIEQRDHTVWQDDPTEVADRLGWLDAPRVAVETGPELRAIAEEVVADGFTDVVVVGMGGSSLFPEVLARTFGPVPDHPTLHVLDTTDPGAVLATEARLPWETTLVVPASKSGPPIEMWCLHGRL